MISGDTKAFIPSHSSFALEGRPSSRDIKCDAFIELHILIIFCI